MIEKYYTVQQVSRLLSVSTITVYSWLKEGKLKGYRPGGRYWRIKQSDFESFANKESNHGSAEKA